MFVDDDFYGRIAQMAVSQFEAGQRGSGRTTELLNSYKTGDLIICEQERSKSRLIRELKALGHEDPVVVVIDPTTIYGFDKLHMIRANKVYFDHHWLYLYFQHSISLVTRNLKEIRSIVKQPSESVRSEVFRRGQTIRD